MYVDANDAQFKEAIARYDCLNAYTTPVKKMTRKLIGRDAEVRSIRAVFERPELSNVILLGEAGSGKAFDNDTEIAVADSRGYVRIGDIKVGDVVFDETGNPTEVEGVYPQGPKDAYLVRFAGGEELVCCDEHLWSVRDAKAHATDGEYVTKSLRELIDAGIRQRAKHSGENGATSPVWYVPANGAVKREVVEVPADPYVAGVLSSNGYAYDEGRGEFSMQVAQTGESVHIPEVYFCGSIQQRRALLQGLMDVHGTVCGTGENLSCGFVSGSDALAEDVRTLAASLGYRTQLWDREDGTIEIEFVIPPNKCDELFSVSPERKRMCRDGRSGGVSIRRYADVAIEDVQDLHEKREMTCIRVKADSHLFQAGRCHIVTHNTALVQGTMELDKNRIYLEVDLSRMIAELPNVDELGDRLKQLFAEAAAFSECEKHGLVLFIDEFHQIVQLSPAAVEALKPLLADSATRNIRVIASTTYVEFRKYISANQPLVERLHRINLSEPDKETCIEILKGMAKTYGVADRIIGNSLYEQIYDVTNRYIPANAQPRKSILILDAMVGWYRAERRPLNKRLLADVVFESEGVNIAFRVDPTNIKRELDKRVLAQDYATRAVSERLQLCVADLNDKTRPSASFLFAGSTGSGKACSNDTLVPSLSQEDGSLQYVRHGDLKEDDIVFDRLGKPTRVSAVFPQYDQQMYRVKFSDGRFVDVSGEHLWSVWAREESAREGNIDRLETLTTAQLLGGRWYLPVAGAVETQEQAYLMDPYTMGGMVGANIVSDISDYADYLGGSIEQRWDFLRGMMDALPGAYYDADNKQVNISADTRELKNALLNVVRSLGVSARAYHDSDFGAYHVYINVAGHAPAEFFENEVPKSAQGVDVVPARIYDVIESIEALGTEDCQCVYVDNDEHLYQVGDFVVTHNTQLTKCLAELLFGDSSRSLIRLDMTEFSQSESVERFRIDLTTRVWERPYSIVLLDEVEKACPEVTRILLQVLDDGRLTDQNGREVSFLNCYIVMTTNAGTEIYKTIAQYEASDTGEGDFIARYDRLIRRSLVASTGNRFPPELLGRIDCIVPFQPLSRGTMKDILIMRLRELAMELLNQYGIKLSVNTRVVNYIVEDSLTTDSDAGGARAIMSKLQSEVTTQIAAFINRHPDVKELHVDIEGELVSENKNKRVGDAFVVVSSVI